MKSISGKVTSTKEISLSKASKYLSNFVHADNNGASQAVSSYLRRASAAFDELVQLHKDLQANKSARKPTKPKQESLGTLDGETVKQDENEGGEGKRHKKKRRTSEDSSSKKEKKRRRIERED